MNYIVQPPGSSRQVPVELKRVVVSSSVHKGRLVDHLFLADGIEDVLYGMTVTTLDCVSVQEAGIYADGAMRIPRVFCVGTNDSTRAQAMLLAANHYFRACTGQELRSELSPHGCEEQAWKNLAEIGLANKKKRTIAYGTVSWPKYEYVMAPEAFTLRGISKLS